MGLNNYTYDRKADNANREFVSYVSVQSKKLFSLFFAELYSCPLTLFKNNN